jgi:hypothetical protein
MFKLIMAIFYPILFLVKIEDIYSYDGGTAAASYLVGYEGMSSYASICIYHLWFGIAMELHTLMGMKAGVRVHWYAFLDG